MTTTTSDADLLTAAECAQLLGVTYSTFTSYVSREQAPGPDGYFKHTPYWRRATIVEWNRSRRGQGWRAGS